MIKLKLCPFCGATRGLYALDVDNSTSGEPQVFCDNCKAVFECERASTIEEAIEAWNTRYVDGDTSDGYHTFNELYHHRAVLFSKIVEFAKEAAWKSRLHAEGTMFEGYFIVGVETPDGQATYHYKIDPYWEMFDCKEVERAPIWDGHTPQEAIARIERWNTRYVDATQHTHCCPCGAERTCEGHRCEETGEWVCHKCGGSLAGHMFDPVRDGFVDVPNFCPNCGSKAVK